jgi:hypothetical protein
MGGCRGVLKITQIFGVGLGNFVEAFQDLDHASFNATLIGLVLLEVL